MIEAARWLFSAVSMAGGDGVGGLAMQAEGADHPGGNIGRRVGDEAEDGDGDENSGKSDRNDASVTAAAR